MNLPPETLEPATQVPEQQVRKNSFQEMAQQVLALWPRMSRAEKESAEKLLGRLARGYRTNKYIQAIRPKIHFKQQLYLSLECVEAFFGGAAGGGKTDALLLAALQYIDVPNYSAILFRKTYTDMQGAGAIMTRAVQWMRAFPEVRWSSQDKTFYFPGEARLSFAYLENDADRERYQGWEFQFVGFDELTHHPEENYTYLFSRLRRKSGMLIPLRMRSTSNPGGTYGEWVRTRFVPTEYLKASESEQFSRIWKVSQRCTRCDGDGFFTDEDCKKNPETGLPIPEPCCYCDGRGQQRRFFVPSRLVDNPSLDKREYRRSLQMLSAKDQASLEHGRWDFVESGGVFDAAWFQYYGMAGDSIRWMGRNRSGEHQMMILPAKGAGSGIRFQTIDTASKDKTFSDWTVIATWAICPVSGNLFLLNVRRAKMQVPDIVPAIVEQAGLFRATVLVIEDAASGIGVIQELGRLKTGQHAALPRYISGNSQAGPAPDWQLSSFAVLPYSPHDGSKISRASVAQVMARTGKIFLPSGSPEWLSSWLAEVIKFPNDLHDDCVDTLSMAAWYASDPSTQAMLSAGPPQLGVAHGTAPIRPVAASEFSGLGSGFPGSGFPGSVSGFR